MNLAGEPQAQHSHLIDIFAWGNLVLGILATLVLLLMMLAFRDAGTAGQLMATLQSPELQQPASQAGASAPALSRTVLGASLALNLLMTYASYALLKRRNWARLFWIALMSLVAAWCIAGLFFPMDVSRLSGELGQVPPELRGEIESLLPLVKVSAYVVSLALAALCAWLAWRFRSPDIRGEFKAK